MRALMVLVTLAFLGWSGWWWVASRGALQGAEAGIALMQAQGWRIAHDGLSVQGYPNRIDLTARAPEVTAPGGQWGWQAPFVQVFALSYRPWHLIAAFPPSQQIATPLGPVALNSGRLQASLVVVPGTALQLDRLQIAGEALELQGGATLQAERVFLATRPTVGKALAHDLGLALENITLDPALRRALPPGLFPDLMAGLRLDAELDFTAPLDRSIAATGLPPLAGLTLREARMEWGPVKLHLSGQLRPDAAGLAEGTLSLRLEGALAALDLAVAAGLVAPQAKATWTRVLSGLAPEGTALDLPLRLSRGLVSLGPLPLGPAPRLR